jgi:hypothetical protein
LVSTAGAAPGQWGDLVNAVDLGIEDESAYGSDHEWHEFEPIDGDPYHERCMCGLMRSVIDKNNAEFA